MQEDSKRQFILALSKAQAEMKPATKDSNNPFFKSRYADYNSVVNALREPLAKYEFSYSHSHKCTGNVLYVTTYLKHSGGHEEPSELCLEISNDGKTNRLQAMGSAISYMKRYNLASLTGISTDDDDDGNSAISSNGIAKPSIPLIISKDQAQLLNEILGKCDTDYQKAVLNHLKSQGIPSINLLPLSLYDRVLSAATQKYEASNVSSDNE